MNSTEEPIHIAITRKVRRSHVTQFEHALSSYLDLVNIVLAGGAGIESALEAAAEAGDGWVFDEIRQALVRARATRRSPSLYLGELGRELGKRSARFPHGREHLQRRHDAVARGVLVEADKVAGVLAAELPSSLAHQFEHIAVADPRAREGDSKPRHRLLEGVVGHQRPRYARHFLPAGAVLGYREEKLVAVVAPPGRVHHEDAVAVSIERNAQVCLLRKDVFLEAIG